MPGTLPWGKTQEPDSSLSVCSFPVWEGDLSECERAGEPMQQNISKLFLYLPV